MARERQHQPRALSRRSLLGGAAAAAGAVTLTTTAAGPASAASTRDVDVAIVGGGLAGLTAARDLVAGGRTVAVLEARDRVGGRVVNLPLANGGFTEGGGEFIGPTQDRIKALADSLGVATFTTYNTGKNLLYKDGKKTPYATDGILGSVPPVDAAGLANAAIVQASLDDMAKQVPVDAPWTAAKAAEWDKQTFESWLNAHAVIPSAKFLLDVACTSIFSAQPRELSLLFVLFYIAAAGNESNAGTLERLTDTANGAQESRFVGGSQQVPIKLAATLGDRVVLSAPVRSIARSGGRYLVTADGITVTAKKVVVAVPRRWPDASSSTRCSRPPATSSASGCRWARSARRSPSTTAPSGGPTASTARSSATPVRSARPSTTHRRTPPTAP